MMTGKPKATKVFFASSKQPKRQEVLTAAVIAATFIILTSAYPSMSRLNIGDISALICAGTGNSSNLCLQTLDAIPLGNSAELALEVFTNLVADEVKGHSLYYDTNSLALTTVKVLREPPLHHTLPSA